MLKLGQLVPSNSQRRRCKSWNRNNMAINPRCYLAFPETRMLPSGIASLPEKRGDAADVQAIICKLQLWVAIMYQGGSLVEVGRAIAKLTSRNQLATRLTCPAKPDNLRRAVICAPITLGPNPHRTEHSDGDYFVAGSNPRSHAQQDRATSGRRFSTSNSLDLFYIYINTFTNYKNKFKVLNLRYLFFWD